jgi:hypothetical protein
MGRVTSRPRSRSPVIRSVTSVAFSVDPFLHGERVLGPVDADAERDDAGVLAEVHPVDHDRDQVQPVQAAAHQLGERGLGPGDEPAGDRRLGGGGGLRLDGLPGGLQPAGITA